MDPVFAIKLDGVTDANQLKIIRWADAIGHDAKRHKQFLSVSTHPRSTRMAHSRATGESTVSNGYLGADVIHLRAGEGFVPHTHPGDHLLIVIGGSGTITYGGKIYPTGAGQIYLIDGNVPHAVGAITDHVILAVGSPHKPVDSPDRMTLVPYEAMIAQIDELHCLICDARARLPHRLHDYNCPHCPCDDCYGTG
jgi:quercetin dioxygenase-like cupin family protein